MLRAARRLASTARLHALPALPYAPDALAPAISAETMRVHHETLHAGYVANLNRALEAHARAAACVPPDVAGMLLAARDVRYHGGAHRNHSLYWRSLRPGTASGPDDAALIAAIEGAFGSVQGLRHVLFAAAMAVRGSGWAYLLHDPGVSTVEPRASAAPAQGAAGRLVVLTSANQEPPPDGLVPLLAIDVWEHAYFLDHRARRAAYLDALWPHLNWAFAAEQLASATGVVPVPKVDK